MTIEELAAKVESLENELQRTKDVTAVANLMATYMRIHVTNPGYDWNETNSWLLFAPRDDSSIEISGNGILMGIDNIRAFYTRGKEYRVPTTAITDNAKVDFVEPEPIVGPDGKPRQPMGRGAMMIHTLASPMIVVANDGQTARASWESPGHETIGKPESCEWAWGKIAADFIKIDGQWYIWHYHWYRTMRTKFTVPWSDKSGNTNAMRYITPEMLEKCGGDPSKVLPTSKTGCYDPDEYLDICPRPIGEYETYDWDTMFPC
jgi:hypothetical protein